MTDGNDLHAAGSGALGGGTRRWWVLVLVAALMVAVAGGGYLLADRSTPASSMTIRAGQVMPFDLRATTHTFTKTAAGGVEKVVVNNSADTRDRALIRSHLGKEAELFRAGNFSDPAKIHGMNMPGLKALEAGASRVRVTYADVPGGAQITYSAAEPALVSALHSWFDRQVADHSMPGMGG